MNGNEPTLTTQMERRQERTNEAYANLERREAAAGFAARPMSASAMRLFELGCSITKSHADMLKAQKEYEDAMAGLPDNKPTEQDINRMATIDAEKQTEAQRPLHKFNYRQE
jgi:hypothetical protein